MAGQLQVNGISYLTAHLPQIANSLWVYTQPRSQAPLHKSLGTRLVYTLMHFFSSTRNSYCKETIKLVQSRKIMYFTLLASLSRKVNQQQQKNIPEKIGGESQLQVPFCLAWQNLMASSNWGGPPSDVTLPPSMFVACIHKGVTMSSQRLVCRRFTTEHLWGGSCQQCGVEPKQKILHSLLRYKMASV